MGLLGTRLETVDVQAPIAEGVLMDQAGLNPEDCVFFCSARCT